ncbi:hypothetical protein LCL95_01080 [Bacillus timonensis]|nr:hypothetical protein [Bacillus timonensis]
MSVHNRAVMQTLNICLLSMFFLVAAIYIFHSGELKTTVIGQVLAVGMLLFWIVRTICQVLFFNLRKRIHQVLFILFLIGILIHTLAILT